MSSLAIEMQQALALAHEDLACYAVAVWPQFSLANHHELIVSRLEAVERGEISRLMIFLPPRHGKSLLASTIFSAWYLGRHSERHGFSFLRPFNCRSPHSPVSSSKMQFAESSRGNLRLSVTCSAPFSRACGR
jgi:hypothetical protein